MVDRPRAFLLDENIPRKVLSVLQAAGYTATRFYEIRLRSQPDTAIFNYARAYQMTIITFDTDYLKQPLFSPPHAGILVLRFFPRDISMRELASTVLIAVRLLDNFDISNRVYQLTPDGLEEIKTL